MIDFDDSRVRAALKDAMAEDGDWDADGAGRDLWPAMRARLDAPPAPPRSLFDWALAAAIVAAAAAFPQLMLGVLYHL